jgi:hypothetical protein
MCLMRDDIQAASTANVILFGSLREDYGFFSNFAPTPDSARTASRQRATSSRPFPARG